MLGASKAQAETQKRALQALQAPGMEIVALKGEGNVRALFNAREKSAFIVAQGVVAAADKDYELWIIRGDAKIAAGLLKADASGMAVLEVDRRLLDGPVDALAITLEPSGGGPVPRGPIMYVGTPKKG
jgi:anti-sigma-K factor RskA